MPQSMARCDQCGQPVEQSFGEGGLGWHASLYCPSCGNRQAADGHLPMPAEFRQIILQDQGEWVLEATMVPSVEMLKVLREVLHLSLSEVQQLRVQLPGEVARGTKYEMTQFLISVQAQDTCGLVIRLSGT
jgi:hypothetical protein